MKNLTSIEKVIEDAKNGKMFILVDDEDRENEGDLIIPGEFATAEMINFMATHARGLICLALDKTQIEKLGLTLMSKRNNSRHQTAFTISIEAKEGVTTGISASDRAKTIAVAIDESSTKDDVATPGHIFPLQAREGGVLVRAGHTEAAVDISKLAGLKASGVICEIMNEDGSMARMDNLIEFAKKHNLNIATIADLIAYRLKQDKLVDKVHEQSADLLHGTDFKLSIYKTKNSEVEHVALTKGDFKNNDCVLVRMHAANYGFDFLHLKQNKKSTQLANAIKTIDKEDKGAIVILNNPNFLRISDSLKNTGKNQERNKDIEIRNYGIGAQILLDLGIKKMTLLTNSPHNIIALDGYGIEVCDYRNID